MISTAQIHWIAGLLEGEGTFTKTTPASQTLGSCSIRVGFSSTDQDVTLKLANLLGFGSIHRITPKTNRWSSREQFRWETAGIRAAGLMMTVYTLMGKRRQEKIRELLAYYRSTGARRKSRAQINRQFSFG